MHLTALAETLDISIETLIGTPAKRRTGKRGPAPKIQQQLQQIGALPVAKKRAIAMMLDSMLAQTKP